MKRMFVEERENAFVSTQTRDEAYKTFIGRHMRKVGMPHVAGKGRAEEIKLINGITLGMGLRYDTLVVTQISG